eukprot:4434421-Amphidinium_carterae.2
MDTAWTCHELVLHTLNQGDAYNKNGTDMQEGTSAAVSHCCVCVFTVAPGAQSRSLSAPSK